MDSNILDELLTKIKNLEASNLNLKTKCKELETKLTISDSKNKDQMDEEINGNTILNLAVINQVENPQNTNDIDRTQFLENLKEITISYIPYEQVNDLYIMGDFTGWEPKLMQRNKDIFFFTLILIKGFKYYFCFQERENMQIDMNSEYETNPRNNQMNNFINLGGEDNIFDFKEHLTILKEAEQIYTKSRMANQEEVRLLETMIKNNEILNSQILKLTQRNQIEKSKIKKHYE
jgi:hypothetical protein